MLLKMEYFQKKKKGKGLTSILDRQLKMLTLKKMLQRLAIALAQVKASNNSEKLFNEVRQVVYFLY